MKMELKLSTIYITDSIGSVTRTTQKMWFLRIPVWKHFLYLITLDLSVFYQLHKKPNISS